MLCYFASINGLAKAQQTHAINYLVLVFQKNQHVHGKFTHTISDSATSPTQRMHGLYFAKFASPMQFKWKYTHPTIHQILYHRKQFSLKRGQFKTHALDGTTSERANNSPVKKFPSSMSPMAAFDVPAHRWIKNIVIVDMKELSGVALKAYPQFNPKKHPCIIKISAVMGGKSSDKKPLTSAKPPLTLLIDKNTLSLIAWSFKDKNGKEHTITLFQSDAPLKQDVKTIYAID